MSFDNLYWLDKTHKKERQVARSKKYKNVGAGGTTTNRLTEAQRDEIYRRIKRFESPLKLAKEFGVNVDSIHRLVKRKDKSK